VNALKPINFANDLSKLSALIRETTALAEAASKRLDEVLATKDALFGHVPGEVSDEIILKELEWRKTRLLDGVFDKTMDILHRRRAKQGQWTEPKKQEAVWAEYMRLVKLVNSIQDRAWKSDVLIPSVRTGLLTRMRRESKDRCAWTNGDLEEAYLFHKFSTTHPWKDEAEFPEMKDEDIKDRTKRRRDWSRERRIRLRQQLFWAVKASGTLFRYDGPGKYDWKIRDDQGNARLIRLVSPEDGRKNAKFLLDNRGDQDWILGRMMYFNARHDIEWKATSKGAVANVGTIPKEWVGGALVLFEYMEDRVLDPA
jgi:hypothetical protein